jgi:hypothetical protein
VMRRMQDIQDAEAESVRDLTHLLDAELDFHERCVEELRRARQNWPASTTRRSYSPVESRPAVRRSNTSHSFMDRLSRSNTVESETTTAPAVRMPIRPSPRVQQVDGPARPSIGRSNSTLQSSTGLDRERTRASYIGSSTTGQGMPADVGSLRSQLRPVGRAREDDIFADRDDDTASDSSGPAWSNHSVSSASTGDGLSRTPSHCATATLDGSRLVSGVKKAPPPPPPNRAKKPAPPVPPRRY